MNVEDKLVNILINKGYHVAFVESCTGGLAVARIVNVANASKVLNCSFIAYSNDAKINLVNVNPDTLDQYGAVSEEVVREMASGVAKAAKAEIGVGISGIVGPSGGSKEKPIGIVCFGIQINDINYTFTEYFQSQSRNEIRNSSVEFILNKLLELI
jgi:nicotinamide-nucleotide amidase